MPFFSKQSQPSCDSSSVQSSSITMSLIRKDASSPKQKAASPLNSTATSSDQSSPNFPGVSPKTQYRAKDFGAVSNKYGAIGSGSMFSTL
ncbi:hypothetical protein FRC08_014024 [Ceratobasidium sp. 394]|nr:hypothetical protein FRC08_014024 [Ceratobasidium sp. 394]